MIEEFAHVVAVEEHGYAWIKPLRATSCGQCGISQGCGSSWLTKFMGHRQTRVRVIDPIGSQTGDHVTIGIHESVFLRGAFSIYGIPLLTMIGMALMGDTLMDGSVYQDLSGLVFGLSGLGLGLAWLRQFAKQILYDMRYLPVILRRVPAELLRAPMSP